MHPIWFFKVNNTTTEQSIQEKLNGYALLPQGTGLGYRLIRQNTVTVDGNNGIKVEYLLGYRYNFEILFGVNGKLYTLGYKDVSLRVPETVPLANKVVESFQTIR